MGKRDCKYQIVYRDEALEYFISGGWFFSTPKRVRGGYWLGRTYQDCFWLELEFPVSLHDGVVFLMEVTRIEQQSDEFYMNYSLFD
ncbi:hypothetical protein [Raoultella planticola]|uniref:hypothetical protein n=1 Tax=Raoultella planticola TaxID=575 RepID=UPI000516F9E6|nr:hypothetical protein [Raoultella planticola]